MSAKKAKPLRKNKKKKDPRAKIALPKIRFKPFLWACAFSLSLCVLAIGLMVTYSAIIHARTFSAKTVKVTGMTRLTETMVLDQAGIHPGDNIFAVNLSVARRRLLAHPWIDQADVIREIPDAIHIRIVEHKLLAIVDLGKRYLMNTNGKIFKHVSGKAVPVPVISGLFPEDIHVAGRHPMKLETNPHKAVMNIIKLAQKPGNRIKMDQIKEILVDREIGLTLMSDGPFKRIKLGYGDFEDKLKRMSDVSTYLKEKAGLDEMDTIDLTNINRIVVKPMAEEGARV